MGGAANSDRLYALSETFRAFAEVTRDHRALLDTVARVMTRLIGDGCIVMLLGDDGGWLTTGAAYARDDHATEILRAGIARLPQGRTAGGFSAHVGKTGESVLIPTISIEELASHAEAPFVEMLGKIGRAHV